MNPFLEPDPPDTLRFEAQAGEVFITVLPDSLGGRPAGDFTNLRVPARSWRAGRAFFWQPGLEELGVHHIVFVARNRSSSDTLTLAVTVRP